MSTPPLFPFHPAELLHGFHRAELRAAHTAILLPWVVTLRKRLFVHSLGGLGIQRQTKLLGPVEVESGPAHRVVPILCPGPTPGYVGVTVFPPPVNAFTRGVVASDILTFCRLPTCRPGASRSCPPSASESSPQLASRQRANGSPRRASDTQTSMFSVFFATRTRRRSTRSTSTSGSSTSCRRGCSTASFRCRRVSS